MHPVLLHIGGFGVPAYGVFAALGILAATALALVLARYRDIRSDFVLDAVFWCIVAGFAGARATYLIVEWRQTLQDPVGAIFSGGGGVYLGGAFAGAAALYFCTRRYKIPFASAADLFAPALALGHAFGRIGCVFAGCCYGAITNSAAALKYPKIVSSTNEIVGSWPYLDHLSRSLVTTAHSRSLAVHPVQIYEAAASFLLSGILAAVLMRKCRPGLVALLYLAAYSTLRFALEFLRGDAERGIFGGLSFAQWLSAFGFTAAAALLLKQKNRPGFTPAG